MGRVYCKCDFSKVLKKLDDIEKKMSDDAIQDALEEAGKYMRELIKSNAPRLSGALIDSIDYKLKGNVVTVGVDHRTNPRIFIYSVVNEFGSAKMSANPFMRVSWSEGQDEVQQIILDKILSLLAS